jgi:hypothetical protein
MTSFQRRGVVLGAVIGCLAVLAWGFLADNKLSWGWISLSVLGAVGGGVVGFRIASDEGSRGRRRWQ